MKQTTSAHHLLPTHVSVFYMYFSLFFFLEQHHNKISQLLLLT